MNRNVEGGDLPPIRDHHEEGGWIERLGVARHTARWQCVDGPCWESGCHPPPPTTTEEFKGLSPPPTSTFNTSAIAAMFPRQSINHSPPSWPRRCAGDLPLGWQVANNPVVGGARCSQVPHILIRFESIASFRSPCVSVTFGVALLHCECEPFVNIYWFCCCTTWFLGSSDVDLCCRCSECVDMCCRMV